MKKTFTAQLGNYLSTILEWSIAAGIVAGLFVALPITCYVLAAGALYGLTVLIGGY